MGLENDLPKESREAATAFTGTVTTMNQRKRHAATDSPIRNRLYADSRDLLAVIKRVAKYEIFCRRHAP